MRYLRLPRIAKQYPIAFSIALVLHIIFIVILLNYKNDATWQPLKIKPKLAQTTGDVSLPRGVMVDFELIKQEKDRIRAKKQKQTNEFKAKQQELKQIEKQKHLAIKKRKQAKQKRLSEERATKLAQKKRIKEEVATKRALSKKKQAEAKQKSAEKATKLAQKKRNQEQAEAKHALVKQKQAEAKQKSAEKATTLAKQKYSEEQIKIKKALVQKKQAEAKRIAAEKAAELAKQKQKQAEIETKKALKYKEKIEKQRQVTEKALLVSVERFKQEKRKHNLNRGLLKEEIQENKQALDKQLRELKADYGALVQADVRKNWRASRLFKKQWHCTVLAKQNKQGVVSIVNIVRCNNDSKEFKRSVKSAVFKASPLPLAPVVDVFDEIIQFEFRPVQ